MASTDDVRAYWNRHIHDLEITAHPVGSRGFFDDLDQYHFEKLHHLLRLVAFDGYRGRSVLEVGCSVGVFTELLAAEFEQVTAIDISREALVLAARHSRPNTRFMRSDIRQVPATSRYDVIVCAEILYYLPEEDVVPVMDKLAGLLSDRGIVVTVSGIAGSRSDARYFDDWNDALAERFERLAVVDVDHPSRPYRIAAFAIDRAPH